MATRAEAKAKVLRISREFGFVEDDIMAEIKAWRPDIRRLIEDSMLAKDTRAAHSIKTVAKIHPSGDARFVFELLLNADNNRFTRARANGDLPFISFKFHPNRIIVECNEDGFTGDDISALCSVGQSTKSGSHGYFATKGIGFKSVFLAAWKVYIQSGNFSFYFKHERGDLGLGMVVPVWMDTDEELPQPLTRMTLHLHEKGDQAELKNLRDTIVKRLNALQQTCLLFLRNLKQIHVSFYDEDGELESSKKFEVSNLDSHRVLLETSSTDGEGEVTVDKGYYHVTRDTAYGISKSNNRELPNTEKAIQESSKTEVIMAFPLTGDLEPIEQMERLFALLPVTVMDFYFITESHSDITANGQDTLLTACRSSDLFNAVTTGFVKAVLQFCEHKTLCYTWPTFLPSSNERSTWFWKDLTREIKSRLSETPILRSRHRTDLRLISDVRSWPALAADSKGDPLFEDPNTDLYISEKYSPVSRLTLAIRLDLKVVSFDEILDALEVDLKSPTSKMKSKSTDKEWHSKAAKLLSWGLQETDESRVARLKSMPILPLRSGQWVSTKGDKLYLPTTNGIPIPPTIKFVLDSAAVANQDRKALFVLLGAIEPPIATIRRCILKAYTESSIQLMRLSRSKSHLWYLYRSHEQEDNAQNHLGDIKIYDSNSILVNPRIENCYFPSISPSFAYGPEALLQPTPTAPGLHVKVLHPAYLEDIPSVPSTSHPTWSKWLHDALGIQYRLRLLSPRGDSLSDIWIYVAAHRPEKLLDLLRHLWIYEGKRIAGNQSIIDQIRATPASKLCGLECTEGDFEHSWTLKDTWLPLPNLRSESLRYMEKNENFPFLVLRGANTMLAEQILTRWAGVLDTFKIYRPQGLVFLLFVLYNICQGDKRVGEFVRPERIVDLYIAIDAACTASKNRGAAWNRVRNLFDTCPCAFLPNSSNPRGRWRNREDIVWDGPPDMIQFGSLEHAYQQMLGPDSEQMMPLSHFFLQTLSVNGATARDIVREILGLRDSEKTHLESGGHWGIDRLHGLYMYLSVMALDDTSFDDTFFDDTSLDGDIRTIFASENIIYVLKNGRYSWHKLMDCVWSSIPDIPGKAVLNEHYGDLKQFFVDKLGVQTLTLQMIYDKLLQADQERERTVEDVKSCIWAFNSLLQTQPDQRHQLDPGPLLAAPVFPVKYPGGGNRLVSAVDHEFAIVDRGPWATRFHDRIKFLDYTLSEVQQLRPFFEWTNLEHRYLSKTVMESTSIGDVAEGNQDISLPKRDLKRKAHALLRIAATFGSPYYQSDPQRLYDLLRTTRVIETTGIYCTLTISQDGQAIQVEEPVGGDICMFEGFDTLYIWVPFDKKLQEFCFCSLLPLRLADWLMRYSTAPIVGGSVVPGGNVDSRMVSALTALLAADLSAVDLILDYQGIIMVPFNNDDIVEDDEEEEEEEQDDFVYPQPSPEDIQYRALLQRVTTAVRSADSIVRGSFGMVCDLGNFPSTSLNNFASFVDSEDLDSSFRLGNQHERGMKIGAAGELFVFEVLSEFLTGPRSGYEHGFDRSNWQSTMRRYVAAHHPDYADMYPWDGQEVADFTFDDTEGSLRTLLCELGYVDDISIDTNTSGHVTKYFIEVKTTTGPYGTPFNMSKGQFQRMTAIHTSNEGLAHPKEVYVVFHVFNIESNPPGMCVYIDPEQLRLDGELEVEYTGEAYRVSPA